MHYSPRRIQWDEGEAHAQEAHQLGRPGLHEEEEDLEGAGHSYPSFPSSLFESTAFYNLGRILSMEQEGRRETDRALGGLSGSQHGGMLTGLRIVPSEPRRVGEEVVEERDGSYIMCSLRPPAPDSPISAN
ncbi:hypothetical protein NGA_0155400, partial [Nannochloropsis gaditana CCMP526]|uniref:uncharacterized protein n=1 Tax=Nannochloropsis gaditana (strain CCMP526) TaxID=1093141 RepID=UPI00029F7E34